MFNLRYWLLCNLSQVEVRAASHLERLIRVSHSSNKVLRKQIRQERKHARMLRVLAGLPAYRLAGSDSQIDQPDRALKGLSSNRLVRLLYGRFPSQLPRSLQLAKIQIFELAALINYSLVLLLPIWSLTDRRALRQIRSEEFDHFKLLKDLVSLKITISTIAQMLIGVLIFIFCPLAEKDMSDL